MSLKLENIKWNLSDENGVNKEIIKDISLEFGDGKLIVVTGPNGGGKTTLAKLIAGVVTPSAGKILLEKDGILRPNNIIVNGSVSRALNADWTLAANEGYKLEK